MDDAQPGLYIFKQKTLSDFKYLFIIIRALIRLSDYSLRRVNDNNTKDANETCDVA